MIDGARMVLPVADCARNGRSHKAVEFKEVMSQTSGWRRLRGRCPRPFPSEYGSIFVEYRELPSLAEVALAKAG